MIILYYSLSSTIMNIERYYPDWNNIYDMLWGSDHDALKKLLSENNDNDLKKFLQGHKFEQLSIEINEDKFKTGSFGWVYTDATYKGKDVVVKRLKNNDDIRVFFLESVIQCILHNYTKDKNCPIKVPEIYKFGKCKFRNKSNVHVIVMQKVNGMPLYEESYFVSRRIRMIVRGLKQLQTDFNFVHRDFHVGNVMVEDGIPYMIDFGRTCIGNFHAAPLYDKTAWWPTKCTNKSHDICTLIVSFANAVPTNERIKNMAIRIKNMAISMCNEYRKKVVKSPSMDIDRNNDYRGMKWTDTIFHWHYIMALEEVQLDNFTPEALLVPPLQKYLKLRF